MTCTIFKYYSELILFKQLDIEVGWYSGIPCFTYYKYYKNIIVEFQIFYILEYYVGMSTFKKYVVSIIQNEITYVLVSTSYG